MELSALLGLVLLLHVPQIRATQGILHAVGDGSNSAKDYCITYNSSWTTLPTSYTNAVYYKLQNISSVRLCSESEVPSTGLKDKAVVVMVGDCPILDKAMIAQNYNAKMLLVASNDGLPRPTDNRSGGYENLTIPIAYVKYGDIVGMEQDVGRNINVTMYSPSPPLFDYSMLVIFLISVFTVALGGYWSGVSELELLRPSQSTGDNDGGKKKEGRGKKKLTPSLTVILMVVISCVMLLLLYFCYKWFVYVIIGVFCLLSALSMFNCLSALIQYIPYGRCRVSCFGKSGEVRLIFLVAFCVALSVTWVVFRNEDRIWILHDILGIALCLNCIKTFIMPNFKTCTILLGLMLLYDVFFVFITPFITKNGQSIMIEVAAGPSGNTEENGENYLEVPADSQATFEKLPIVIRVPRLEYSAAKLCLMPFSLLGFGDIMLPGLLVAYCRRFDVRFTSASTYFISCTIGYAVGMILTLVVLIALNMGQPALLYLVPCTLLASSVVAWRRKEMKKFWNGGCYKIMEEADNTVSEENIIRDEAQEAP